MEEEVEVTEKEIPTKEKLSEEKEIEAWLTDLPETEAGESPQRKKYLEAIKAWEKYPENPELRHKADIAPKAYNKYLFEKYAEEQGKKVKK